MADTPFRFSSPPQRKAANTSARARTGRARRAVRSSPYTAPARSIRSLAHWASACGLGLVNGAVGVDLAQSLAVNRGVRVVRVALHPVARGEQLPADPRPASDVAVQLFGTGERPLGLGEKRGGDGRRQRCLVPDRGAARLHRGPGRRPGLGTGGAPASRLGGRRGGAAPARCTAHRCAGPRDSKPRHSGTDARNCGGPWHGRRESSHTPQCPRTGCCSPAATVPPGQRRRCPEPRLRLARCPRDSRRPPRSRMPWCSPAARESPEQSRRSPQQPPPRNGRGGVP